MTMTGDENSDLVKNDMRIKGTRYTGTHCLYELIFMKQPDEEYYSENDLIAYKTILIATNAHKQRYNPIKQINYNMSYIYFNIIRNIS